jgi:ATP synthase protein I
MVLPQQLPNNVTTRTLQHNEMRVDPDDSAVEDGEESFKSLTREEAQALRARLPQVSPWRVVGAQAIAGVLMAGASWAVTGRGEVVWSALYGAATVVLPTALLARGMSRVTRLPEVKANVAAFNFMFWEFLKIGVSVVMLAAATKVVPSLSWPAMLITLVVCMKMNWLALLWQGRVNTTRS